MSDALHVLVVDDEQPVLDELVYLLGREPAIGTVEAAASGAEALGMLRDGAVDAVYLDIAMPGLSGLDVARLLAQFRTPPALVFVTAHDDHAIDAFEVGAVDYLLKPISADRLRESVRRITSARSVAAPTTPAADSDETIAVELGGVTRFVPRSQVAYVEAQGDYVRLHTAAGDSHLLRRPLTVLERDWADAGFVRIHRSLLVSTAHVREVRVQSGRCSVLVERAPEDAVELHVARRHTRDLRDLLQRRGRSA